jgi:hypothetical protein
VELNLQLFKGELDELMKQDPSLFSKRLTHIPKMGFPDIIMPGTLVIYSLNYR